MLEHRYVHPDRPRAAYVLQPLSDGQVRIVKFRDGHYVMESYLYTVEARFFVRGLLSVGWTRYVPKMVGYNGPLRIQTGRIDPHPKKSPKRRAKK